MKKIILLICFSLVIISISLAQETKSQYKNQFQIGYGYNSFNRIYAALWIIIENVESIESGENGSIKNDQEKKFSSLNLAYSRPYKERGTWGISFTSGFYNLTYDKIENGNTFHKKQFTQIYTLTPNLYFHYLQKKTVQMYFGGELGLLLYSVKSKNEEGRYNKVIPVFNICPIGIRLKYKLSPYLQANIGSRGWVEAGISYQFNKTSANKY